MTGGVEPSRSLATTLARMARDLLVQTSVEETLNAILVHAVDLVDGCEAAGITMTKGRSVHTPAASVEKVRGLGQLHNIVGAGPCFDVTRSSDECFRIDDIETTAGRWPRYASHAKRSGIGSILGFNLFTEDETLGVLLLYASRSAASSTNTRPHRSIYKPAGQRHDPIFVWHTPNDHVKAQVRARR